MAINAPNINHYWAQLIVEELVRSGVELFCLAPGSRSTPLTTAVAQHPKAQALTHFDERGTAFFAAGYARAAGQPAAWITTSGTAVANGLPAVVEASADRLPLILLTADRPPELRATGANQTIDQVKLFGEYTRAFFDLPPPDPAVDPSMVLTTVDQAIHQACSSPTGPVHLNCMFRKPLSPDNNPFPEPPADKRFHAWSKETSPYTCYSSTQTTPAPDTTESVAELIDQTNNGLLVAGQLKSRAQGQALQALAKKLQWPLLADVNSQVRLGDNQPETISYFDQLLRQKTFASSHLPEIVLHFGGRCTSKPFRQFLSNHPPREYVVVKNHPYRFDINHSVTRSIETDLESFAQQLLQQVSSQSSSFWLSQWQKASQTVEQVLEEYVASSQALEEPAVTRLLSKLLPEQQGLFLSNSRPVRDMDMFGRPRSSSLPTAANRGASGIDGIVASAAGFSRGLDQPVTLLIGDLALLHDLNSLSLLRNAPHPVVIVVINNNGGGIFSFLPIAEHKNVFEPFFGTPSRVSFEQAANMFDITYYQPASTKEFAAAYRKAAARSKPALLEVQTNRDENVQIHAKIRAAVGKALK